MPDQTIVCPHCSREIPLTETLSIQIKEAVSREFEEKSRKADAELRKREEEIKKRSRELEESRKEIEDTVAGKLALEKARLASELEKGARDRVAAELKDLREQNSIKEKRLEEARNMELEFRRKTRELEEEKKNFELAVARKIDEERENVKQKTLEIFHEEHRLKDLEKDKKIGDMQKMIDDLKRKSEQGSMQVQGEVMELDLEAMLKARFPVDVIEPVAKGIKGADVLQNVYTRGGQLCGAIAWESKRTKAWNDDWITKLKDDQREVKAEVAVLVTETLPKGVSTFAYMDGVWVAGMTVCAPLAEALRIGLIQLCQARSAAAGKGEKMESLYNYLSGPEFRQKIEGIAESFKSMREDLEQEKRALTKIWAKREKQIERVVANTVRMYGDVQGIIGATLPEIKILELGGGDGSTTNNGEI